MISFSKLAALAALCAHANAACSNLSVKRPDPADPLAPKIDVEVFDCADLDADLLAKIEAAVTTYADDYQWALLPLETGYQNNVFTFTGDENGDRIVDTNGDDIQGSKGSVLFVHSATRDCLSWLTTTESESQRSIPQRYFDEGYSVFLACRRGTELSRQAEGIDLTTEDGYKMYFDYNTQTVGTDDIGRYVEAILNEDNIPDNAGCTALQIVTHGLGAGEVYSGLAGSPAWRDQVSHVTNMSPCLVPTYLTSDSSGSSSGWHRMLAEKQSPSGPPRELEELLDMPRR